MSRLVSWLKTSRTGLIARRTSISSRLRRKPLHGLGTGLAHHLVLHVVDRVAEAIGEREVAVDDVVGKRPQHVVRAVAEDRRDPGAQMVRGPRVPARRRGPSAENPARARSRVRVATTRRHRSSLNRTTWIDAVGRLDLGPLVALQDVLDDQRVEAERGADLEPGPALGQVRSTQTARPGAASRSGRPASAASPSQLAGRVRRRPAGHAPRIVPGSAARRRAAPDRVIGSAGFAWLGIGVGSCGRASAGCVARSQHRRVRQHTRPEPPSAEGRRERRRGDRGGDDKQPDHDPGRLARRPRPRAPGPRTSRCSGRSRSASGMNWR